MLKIGRSCLFGNVDYFEMLANVGIKYFFSYQNEFLYVFNILKHKLSSYYVKGLSLDIKSC